MYKILIVLVAVVGLSSCGTVAGLGDDIKSVAKWSENKMSETNEEPKENSDFPVVNTEPVAAKEIE
tara:strand:+ start:205 stop:402 length:198 start_codon:yes stop_codon:yes gene_type:complete